MILVTASRSFVGIEVARQLTTMGYSLRVIVSDATEAQLFDGLSNVELWQTHLRPSEPLELVLADIDKAFVAAPPSAGAPALEADLGHAARVAGITHVVSVSGDSSGTDLTACAGPEPAGISPILLNASVSYQALTVYLLHFAGYGGLAVDEERELAPVDARDVAAVAVAALTRGEHQAKRCFVTGPEKLALCEIADKLSFATGVRIGDFSRAADCGTRWRGWELTVLSELASARDGSVTNLGLAVRQITGRAPISFDDYAAEIAACCPIFKRAM